MSTMAMYFIISIIALLLLALISRAIFSIKRQLWNQKQQINLLIKIAEKLGVDINSEDINRIQKANNGTIDLF